MKKYLYQGGKYTLKELEAKLCRPLTRKELLTLHSEGECGDIGTVYEAGRLYRRPVRGNIVVFRHYQGRVVALCPIKGRQSDYYVPCYDQQWAWVDYRLVMKDSSPCPCDDQILNAVQQEYGKSRVVTKCRPAYPVNDCVKRRYVKKADVPNTQPNTHTEQSTEHIGHTDEHTQLK